MNAGGLRRSPCKFCQGNSFLIRQQVDNRPLALVVHRRPPLDEIHEIEATLWLTRRAVGPRCARSAHYSGASLRVVARPLGECVGRLG